MTPDPMRVEDYLRHILEAIERIQRYTKDLQEEAFSANVLVQDAVIRNLEVIGEASKNAALHGKDRAEISDKIPLLRDVYLMRNRLAHGYFSIALPVVWSTIQKDLPALRQEIREMYDRLTK